jgi:hypothetical protein
VNIKHPANPECVEDLVALTREVAALRTWGELLREEDEGESHVEEYPLDDTILRARCLLDDWGLHVS